MMFFLSEQIHPKQLFLLLDHLEWIQQRSSHVLIIDRHNISLLEHNIFTEAERSGSKEMNVQLAWNTMLLVLEVMMLQVCETVSHRSFSRLYLF